ncbi:MAG: FxDxF family PEP-CTERM protein [Sphingomicrobium sp.]
MASAANATITVTSSSFTSYSGPTSTDGGVTTTIGYEDTGLAKPTFTEWLSFTNTLAGIYSVTLDTSSRSVNFTSAYLTDGTNNYALACISGCSPSTSSIEFWGLDDTVIAAGNYTLNVLGNNSKTGTLGGTITITALPEPGTWAMMLLGFGAIGWQIRRRRSSLALAQAA